ncbi:surface polysaccharide O-acyltransferase-like enzyme [Chitinophaga skermanii]|uniref:Surface polysaccharide O-acyltransferase-like enzyme n=1 Tax=Chitinophaga skermanii TaxID=331697 RepID=A0A327QTG0_9BACT|nr:acyltransferase [Chitinophaga skermanii]RAJ06944.1 surface polysaccharide O-acyltransferase-like enzyme [Chitinophaga skermanii]
MPSAKSLNLPPIKENGQQSFLNYINNFRGFVILLVVSIHILLEWPTGSKTKLVFDIIFQDCTIMFVFMSGYLFQYLGHKFEYKSYLKKKLQNVIIPYFIISIPILVYRLYFKDVPGIVTTLYPNFENWSLGQQLIYYITRGAHMPQLWFIPVIAIYYLLAPVFITIDRNPKLYWVLLLLMAVSMYVQRGENLSDTPRTATYFASAYVFGMFMSRYKNQYLAFAKKTWVFITALTLAAFAACYYFEIIAGPWMYLQKMLCCGFFIYWFWKLDAHVPKIFATLASLSFGIYFLHYYYVLIVRKVGEKIVGGLIPGNILNWVISFSLVMILTTVTIIIIKKITGKNSRILIGC